MSEDEDDDGATEAGTGKRQYKLLLDSNCYFRLAKSLHPLLCHEFGAERYCLYVLPELDQEYARQPRLQTKFPWVQDPEFRHNRQARPQLSRKQQKEIKTAFDFLWDHVQTALPGPSRVDVTVLSYAFVLTIPVVTDDVDMARLGKTFQISLMTTLELLKLMLDSGHVSLAKIRQIVAYWGYLGDQPRELRQEYQRLFGEDAP